ncbi:MULTISPECIES: GNAT family N-acetyltransferase [unclassified Streptomyces]|uniref:GNAT family N-acetyltransferase n=1 Tax=unclassified Streptomyces TaxID=2593676 RepID=UPI002E2E6F20|nr:GNAT family N-acetyltransferase [Streptomyces sp. NBC_01439]
MLQLVLAVSAFTAAAAELLLDGYLDIDGAGAARLTEEGRGPAATTHTTATTRGRVTPRQRNGGIGAVLLEALELHARSAEFDTPIVWPSDRSSPLYRRSGFQPPEEPVELPLDP